MRIESVRQIALNLLIKLIELFSLQLESLYMHMCYNWKVWNYRSKVPSNICIIYENRFLWIKTQLLVIFLWMLTNVCDRLYLLFRNKFDLYTTRYQIVPFRTTCTFRLPLLGKYLSITCRKIQYLLRSTRRFLHGSFIIITDTYHFVINNGIVLSIFFDLFSALFTLSSEIWEHVVALVVCCSSRHGTPTKGVPRPLDNRWEGCKGVSCSLSRTKERFNVSTIINLSNSTLFLFSCLRCKMHAELFWT